MAFNLYFAGADPNADALMQKLNCKRLFSQLNERNRILKWQAQGYAESLFIDSGAFTEAHTGIKVNIEEYIDFINLNKSIKVFAELDKIPYPDLNAKTAKNSSEVSWNNYIYMKKRVRKDCFLLPLYHFGEPIEALRRILNTSVEGEIAPYIGIGGRHGVSTELQRRYFHEIFAIVQKSKNPNVKIHVFGMTVLSLLEQFPFYSADSTTWLQLAMHGCIYTETCGIVLVGSKKQNNLKHLYNSPVNVRNAVENEILKNNFDADKLAVDLSERMRYNVTVFKRWADNYQYKGRKTFISNKLF